MLRLPCLSVLRALCLSAVITGCSTTTTSLREYSVDVTPNMGVTGRPPTEEEVKRSSERIRAVLLGVENAGGGAANDGMSEAFSRIIGDELVKKQVEVVDRSLAGKLDDEIKACELLTGRGKCSSNVAPSVAQFAVKPSVKNASYASVGVPQQQLTGGDSVQLLLIATYGADFVERYAVDGKNDTFIVKPHVLHTATVSTTVKVYEIPSLREVTAVVGSGKEEVRSAPGNADQESALLLSALKSAVPSAQAMADLANVFAPKGYVSGGRSNQKQELIFRVSIGAAQGARQGTNVVISEEVENDNPITKKKSIDLVEVVEATVSNLVTDAEAWVIPNDQEKARKVKLGDRVVVKHKAGLWDDFAKEIPGFGNK